MFSVNQLQYVRLKKFYSPNLRERLKKHHGENVDNAFFGWADVWLNANFLSWNIESSLPKISVPQLIIQGNEDEYGTLSQVETIEIKSGSAVETCFLSNCGHSPHIDQENKTLKKMNLFIRKVIP